MKTRMTDKDRVSGQWSFQEFSRYFLQRARNRWGNEELDSALECLRTSISYAPKNPEAFVLRGIIFAQKGMKVAARQNIRHALALGGAEWSYAGLVGKCLKKVESLAA